MSHNSSRREFFKFAALASVVAPLANAIGSSAAEAQTSEAVCLALATDLTVESKESPFFEHFHQLSIPIAALILPPRAGVTVRTSPVDQGSYDRAAFERFVRSSGLKEDALKAHDHSVVISREQLRQIARGQEIEIRVISKNGNYVHNFLVKASPRVLAHIRKGRASAER